MPSKDRTFIARFSPPKSNLKATAAPYSPTPHHNAPIPLRGTGKPVSSIRPSFGTVGDALPSNLPARPFSPLQQAKTPNGIAPQVQRTINGSRIPAPLKFQGRNGFGLGLALPTSTSGPKAAPVQTSPARTGRPSFHVPVIHSPASRFVSTTDGGHADPDPGIRGNGSKPEGIPATVPTAGTRDAQQIAPSDTPPTLMRTPTVASDVSSESQYTTQSAEGHHSPDPELRDINGSDENKLGEEEHALYSDRTGVDCEDEDVVLSPGFDVIQALADTNKNKDENTASEQSPITPRPPPFPRDMSDLRHPVRAPSSPLASGVAYTSSSSTSSHTVTAYRRSLVGEVVGTMSSNFPPSFPPYSHKAPSSQKSKSKTPPPHPPSHMSGNIPDLIQEVETLIGHPCIDRDAVHVAHRDAMGHSETGSSPGAVFGARLNMTTRYASCTSVLGGQTHTLPLVVFACVEELYRAGLRSSRLLRPPPHAPTTPAHTVSHPPAHAHSATHSFPALVAAFNTPPTYGDDIDLALASLDDVGALLLTYLDCLPGGIVPVWVRSVLGDAVGIYEEGHGDGGSESVRERKRAIRAAQSLLRLLPAAQFSLLVYLLAFLSQIPLYEAWNGWNVRGVARAFARVVVGVGAGERMGNVKGKGKDDSLVNGKGNWKHREEDVDWVAEEEDAVEVLEWLLANWDDLSDGLFLGPQPEGQGRRESDEEGEQDGKEEREMHRAAAMRQLDPPHKVRSDEVTSTIQSNPAASHSSANDLLARIASLERENAKWKWLQGQHESELRLMYQAGEQRVGEAERVLAEERNARAVVEDALMKERAALRNTQTSIEDAIRAERRLWVEEVQALREAWERLGLAWAGVGTTRDEVGSIVGSIVERFAVGASKRSEVPRR